MIEVGQGRESKQEPGACWPAIGSLSGACLASSAISAAYLHNALIIPTGTLYPLAVRPFSVCPSPQVLTTLNLLSLRLFLLDTKFS